MNSTNNLENKYQQSNKDDAFDIHELMQQYEDAKGKIDELQRCTKCILPETFPFISFDENGICNYCHNYEKMNPKGQDALEEVLQSYKSPDGSIKCVVSFSGGRDSSYGLHIAKAVLGLDPIAFTYDWGVAPDLARRNQLRMLEKLGVEQVLLKANLERKHALIKANLQAWLKRPTLETIPLLTSVGQQFFYHVHRVSKRTGRELIIICTTPMEHTHFKTGFSGIEPPFMHTNHFLYEKLRIAFSYLGNYFRNPAYINKSIFNTLGGYISMYFVPRNHLRLFNYIEWDENEVNKTLIDEYQWETSEESANTWRIDDGTVPVSDYMYYMMSGLTINDTFRSNQIREGKITRDKALELVERDNKPRFKAIKWYCDTVGVDFEDTVRAINKAPRLY